MGSLVSLIFQMGVAHKQVIHVCYLKCSVEELLPFSITNRAAPVVAYKKNAVMVCVNFATIEPHESTNHLALIADRMNFVRRDKAKMLFPPPFRLPEILAANHYVAKAHHMRTAHCVCSFHVS